MSLNNENSNLTPGVRSKGFTDDWEQRKFTDYISTVGGGTPSKANPSFWGGNIVWLSSQEIKHPFIDHGTYTITPEAISNSATKMIAADTPLIVYRSGILAHTFPISRPTKDVAINQDIKALIFDHDSLKVQFVVSQLESREQFILHNIVKTGTTVQSVNIPDLNKMPFVRTSIAEQEKIDSLFTNLDKTIALHQRKYDNLRQALHWTQQNLLPEPDSSLPKVRVGKFESDWTLQPLSEIIKKNNERNKGQFPVESTLSIATMRYKPEGNGAVQSSLDGYKVCRIGDIAFEGHTNDTFQYGRFILNLTGDGIISPRFTSFRFKHQDQVDIRYWKRFLHYEPVIHRILAHSTKLGTMMNEIMPDFLLKQLLSVPSLAEQQAIARVFTKLEERIQSEQALIENLKLVKKWALDNMFV